MHFEPEAAVMSRRALLQGGVTGVLAAAGLTAYEIYKARYVNPYSPQLERARHCGAGRLRRSGGHEDRLYHRYPRRTFVKTGDLYRALDLIRRSRPTYSARRRLHIGVAPVRSGDRLRDREPAGGRAARWLRRDREPRPLGLGTRVQEALVTVGIPILRNQTTVVSYGGGLAIAGIDETLLGDPQPVEDDCAGAGRRAGAGAMARAGVRRAGSGSGAFAQLSGHTPAVRSGCRGSARSGSRCMASDT